MRTKILLPLSPGEVKPGPSRLPAAVTSLDRTVFTVLVTLEEAVADLDTIEAPGAVEGLVNSAVSLGQRCLAAGRPELTAAIGAGVLGACGQLPTTHPCRQAFDRLVAEKVITKFARLQPEVGREISRLCGSGQREAASQLTIAWGKCCSDVMGIALGQGLLVDLPETARGADVVQELLRWLTDAVLAAHEGELPPHALAEARRLMLETFEREVQPLGRVLDAAARTPDNPAVQRRAARCCARAIRRWRGRLFAELHGRRHHLDHVHRRPRVRRSGYVPRRGRPTARSDAADSDGADPEPARLRGELSGRPRVAAGPSHVEFFCRGSALSHFFALRVALLLETGLRLIAGCRVLLSRLGDRPITWSVLAHLAHFEMSLYNFGEGHQA